MRDLSDYHRNTYVSVAGHVPNEIPNIASMRKAHDGGAEGLFKDMLILTFIETMVQDRTFENVNY